MEIPCLFLFGSEGWEECRRGVPELLHAKISLLSPPRAATLQCRAVMYMGMKMVDAAMVVLSDKVGVGDESEKDRIVVGSVGWRGSIGGEWMFEGVRQLMEMKVIMMILMM